MAPDAGAAGDGGTRELTHELVRLERRWRAFTPRAWEAAGRRELAHQLTRDLVELTRRSGEPIPAGIAPAQVRPHGIADQLAVLGQDLLDALRARPDPDLAGAATEVVRRARDAFDATTPRLAP